MEKLKSRKIRREELVELKGIVERRIDEFEQCGECEKAQSEAVILGMVEGLLKKMDRSQP
ncbi:hypothetical protein Arcve_0116 [Archaeoglobus veneficus SNP6]|uniref:Uncharacterized protein n=2 Tax=Archaeoglobus veneficus TaxID=58290 RepID=F2KN56_ARCVS|nr:hypothetical protein Arcve_0116 [Archaeoglobus veneficus SNP6]